MSNDNTKETPLSDAEELAAIDAIIHYRSHQLSPSEAVKWMNELYGTQCSELQKIAKDFKMGMGGEKLTTAIRAGIEQARQRDKERIEELTGRLKEAERLLGAAISELRSLRVAEAIKWGASGTDANAYATRRCEDYDTFLSKAKQLGFTPSTQ